MPTYEYVREDGSRFEIIQRMSDNALETCPETGQKCRRVISGGGGVIYKGDGWYVKEYKNNGAPKSESAGKSAEKTETSASAEPKKEPAKPAEKGAEK